VSSQLGVPIATFAGKKIPASSGRSWFSHRFASEACGGREEIFFRVQVLAGREEERKEES
jgi:hypothetical protein